MKRYTFLMLLLFLGAGPIFAQHVCGTSVEAQFEMRERLIQNRANAEQQQTADARDEITYVPIKVHLVAKNDGTGRANEASMPDLLCNLNTEYEGTNIQFYFKMPFNYIDNTPLWGQANEGGGSFQIQTNKVNNALNIFIIGQFTEEGLGGYYLGPFPQNDYIVMPRNAVFSIALPHEVGHFFSLAHPFFGWGQVGDTGWDPAVHGNPVGTYAPLPPPGQQILNEKVDQSNCLEAADAICDTPPDYFFAFSPALGGNCTSPTISALDPNGDEIDPVGDNMMNYFGQCPDYVFTADQSEAMVNDLYSTARNYVRPGITPDLTEITEAPELVSPINGESTPGYNLVEFDWDAVDGADYYVLEIDFLPTFAGSPSRYVVSNATFKVVEDIFNANSTYYWRVRPFGEYFTCGVQYSERGDFVTGSIVATQEVEEVSGWNIRPNPIRTGGMLQIEVEAGQSFQGTINLYSSTGQLLKSLNRLDFNTGGTNVEMDVNGLAAGIYIATIETNFGVLNKKVLITK
jgi:hypothetical protein